MLGSDTSIGTEIRFLLFKFIFQNKLMRLYIDQKLGDDIFFCFKLGRIFQLNHV